MDVVGSVLVYVAWALLLLAYPIFVCFRKGKPVFGWLGIVGLLPPLPFFLGWFAVVGAVRLARPNSPWASRHYPPLKMEAASRRFGGPQLPQARPVVPDATIGDTSTEDRELIVDFLFEAQLRGILDQVTYQNLIAFLTGAKASFLPEETPAAVPVAPPVTEPVPALVASREPASITPETLPTPPPPAEPKASPKPESRALWKRQFGRIGEAIASELALHGFVYLGVLLTFVGVFGFLLFSFRDVPDAAQPLVELAIPLIFFAWAWALRRRDANLIGTGMELLGGLVLPLVLFAGLVDNAPFPPDFRGGSLIAAMVATSLLVALLYWWWSARHPDSALAFLVVPAIWLAGLALGFVFKTDEALEGVAITRLVSFQPAIASMVVTASLAAVGLRPGHRLAHPTLMATAPGMAVAYALTLSLSGREGWARPEPVLLAGVSTLISVELLGWRFEKTRSVSALRPLLLGATLVPLIPIWGLAWTGVAMVVAYLAATEWDLKTGLVGRWTLPVALTGALVGLALSLVEPWPTVVAWTVASVWSHIRRVVGLPHPAAGSLLIAVASVVPIGVATGLLRALPDDVAWLTMSGIVAAMVGAARWSRTGDRFWADWPTVAASAIAVGAAAHWYLAPGGGSSAPLLVAAITMAAMALAGSQQRPAFRVWMTSGALALALAVGLDGAKVASEAKPMVWALVGLTLVVAAAVWRRQSAGHLGLIGHLAGLGSLFPSVSPGGRAVVLGAWTVGWLATVVVGEFDGATVSGLLKREPEPENPLEKRLVASGRWLPSLVLAASAPFAILETAGRWERFADNRAWSGVALGLLAIVYAACARWTVRHRPLSWVLASGAAVLSVIGVAVAAPEQWPSISTAASSIVAASLLAGELRRSAFTWFAWIMSGVLAVLLASRAGVPSRSLDLVALGWGGLLLIGGLAFDDLRGGRRQAGEGLRIAWLRHPVIVGGLAVPVSLGPTFSQGPAVFGWWSLGTAAGYFVVAYLLRVGAVTGPGYALTAVAVTVLLPVSPMIQPVMFVPLAAALVGCSVVADRLQAPTAGGAGWQRWDLPPLVVAHLVAAVALARASDIGSVPSTAIGMGLLSIGVGLWRRNRIWAEAGNLFILVGATGLGPEWLALALLATSLRAVASALFTSGPTRISYQVTAAGAAGWSFTQVIAWQGWTIPEAVSVSAMLFGGLAAMVGALIRFLHLPRDWAVTWGGLAVVGTVLTMAAAPGNIEGLGPALGTGLLALGLGMAAGPLRLNAIEGAAAVATGVAWVELIVGAAWTMERAVVVTSLAAGILALLVALMVRFGLLSRSWGTSWGLLTLFGLIVVSRFTLDPILTRRIGEPGPAIGLGLFALAAAVAARPLSASLHYLSVGTTVWAWTVFGFGRRWGIETFAIWTGLTYGSLALVVAEVARIRRLGAGDALEPADRHSGIRVARAWALLSFTGVLFAALLAGPSVQRGRIWLIVALPMGLLAVATARAAVPLQWPWLRETSGPVALVAVTALAYGVDATASTIALGAMSLGVAATVFQLWLVPSHGSSLWVRPLALTGILANFEALVLAVGMLPRRDLLAAVLLAFGVQTVAAGLVLQHPTILAIGPPLIVVAWFGIAAESLTGSAQWFTAPAAVTLLAEVEIARWSRRHGGEDLSPTRVRLLEWAGIGLLALSPLAEMFTGGLLFGLVALGYSAVVLVWGVLTRIRRRVIAALVLATVAAALTISAAAAGAAPRSAFFWIIAAGAGLAVMLSIGIVESSRSRSGALMHRLDVLMEGWE